MKRKSPLMLDKKDRQLLYLLDVNGRMSYAALAKKSGMSKQRAQYHVERLEREGFIKGYFALIDTSRLGYVSFRVYLKLRTLSASKRSALMTSLSAIPELWALYTFAGRYDLAIGVAVKHPYDFHAVWERILKEHLPAIQDYAIAVYSPVYHYTKAYLVEKPDTSAARVLGGNELVSYDDQDWHLLSLIAANARTSMVQIGEKIGLTPEAVSARIKQLEKKGIIQGYRALIDVHKLGYEYYKADIRLRTYEKMREIQAFCHEHPNIYQFNKTIGGATLEIEFNVKNLQGMLAVIEELEAKFPGVMESFEYLTIVDEIKTQYLPSRAKES